MNQIICQENITLGRELWGLIHSVGGWLIASLVSCIFIFVIRWMNKNQKTQNEILSAWRLITKKLTLYDLIFKTLIERHCDRHPGDEAIFKIFLDADKAAERGDALDKES